MRDQRDRLRRRALALLEYLDGDAPPAVLAMQTVLVWRTASVVCGAELYAELGRKLAADARRYAGLCQDCDSPVDSAATHLPRCPVCQGRLDREAAELEADEHFTAGGTDADPSGTP